MGLVAALKIIKSRNEGFQDIYDAFSKLIINGVGRSTLESFNI